MSEKLKPCPFCGERKRLSVETVRGETFAGCDSCSAQGPSNILTDGNESLVAGDDWNRRTP